MFKKSTTFLTIIGLFLLLPTALFAQSPTSAPGNSTRREQVQENQQERQELRQQNQMERQELRQENQMERQELREENQQERQENRQGRRDERAQNHANRLQNRFRIYSQRLSNLISKLENRLTLLSQEGKQVSAAQTQLEQAKAALSEATRLGEEAVAAFSAIEAESYDAQRAEALAARNLAEDARTQYKAAAGFIREAVSLAKQR